MPDFSEVNEVPEGGEEVRMRVTFRKRSPVQYIEDGREHWYTNSYLVSDEDGETLGSVFRDGNKWYAVHPRLKVDGPHDSRKQAAEVLM